MNLKWILLSGFWMVGLPANAEQPAASEPELYTTGQVGAPVVSQEAANAANRERILKGGKMSPRERAEINKAALVDTSKRAGENFLATNKSKPGVISLPSGVQYLVLRASNGKKPADNSQISCRYKGTLIDGTSFDKFEDKKPSALNVAGLMPGLKEAVKLMPVGSKWEIVVPPQLAYGTKGNRVIGPNAVLIYEMEILSLK